MRNDRSFTQKFAGLRRIQNTTVGQWTVKSTLLSNFYAGLLFFFTMHVFHHILLHVFQNARLFTKNKCTNFLLFLQKLKTIFQTSTPQLLSKNRFFLNRLNPDSNEHSILHFLSCRHQKKLKWICSIGFLGTGYKYEKRLADLHTPSFSSADICYVIFCFAKFYANFLFIKRLEKQFQKIFAISEQTIIYFSMCFIHFTSAFFVHLYKYLSVMVLHKNFYIKFYIKFQNVFDQIQN